MKSCYDSLAERERALKKLGRYCKKCKRRFIPITKFQKLCSECRKWGKEEKEKFN